MCVRNIPLVARSRSVSVMMVDGDLLPAAEEGAGDSDAAEKVTKWARMPHGSAENSLVGNVPVSQFS